MASYQVNHDNIVHDTIDGEVLAIRSDTGAYYSMTGPAATCWVALLGGHALEGVAAAVAAHHSTEARSITAAIGAFAESLVEESLLVTGTDAKPGEPTGLPAETTSIAWAEPTFEKFTDMQDLLLFDPIHEVKPSGWPRAADPSA